MQYIVTTSFYEGNTLHEQGSVFTHEDQTYIEKCLDDGNIAVQGASESSTPEAPAAPVDAADQGATATPAPLEVVSDLSSENTPQTVTPVEPPVTQIPVTQQPAETAPVNPTQAEIEQTLKDSGLDSSSSNDVQIS